MTQLVWFRNDLRVHDNETLYKATLKGNTISVYCFDPRHFGSTSFGFPKTGSFRARFLLESVLALRRQLADYQIPLIISLGFPEQVIPRLIVDFSITDVYLQKEWTTEEKQVLEEVKKSLSPKINFHSFYTQFLLHPEAVPYSDIQKFPKVFTEFRKTCENEVKVRALIDAPKKQDLAFYDNVLSLSPRDKVSEKDLNIHESKMDPRSAFPFEGGSREGQKRLHTYLWEDRNILRYKETRNGLIGAEYSSKFSPWLSNGSLSPRQIYWEIKDFEEKIEKNKSTYWLVFELLWRDFFKYTSLKHGSRLFMLKGIRDQDRSWVHSKELLQQWIHGRTNDDFINANMKEIAQTGWMSNRGRQNVASYWTKELGQDWRIGASYFESLLIDYDVHSNWGNWQYVAGVGNDPRDRKFNVKKQAEVYDPDQEYQNLWLDRTRN